MAGKEQIWFGPSSGTTQSSWHKYQLLGRRLGQGSRQETRKRVFMKLFELLDEMAEERNVEIEWHYHEEDDTMEEFGEEFAEDMENASFQLKSHNDG